MKCLLSFLLLTLLFAGQFSYAQGFKVCGTKIYDPTGKEFIIKGTNIGGPGWSWPEETLANFDDVVKWKFNTIRLVVKGAPSLDSYTSFNCAKTNFPQYQYTTFGTMRQIIQKYTDAKIVVIIDWQEVSGIFTGSELECAKNWWAMLANTYKANPYVWFDMYNEPHTTKAAWTSSFQAVINAIRATGNNSIIVASGNYWGQDANSWECNNVSDSNSAILTSTLNDPASNLVYSIHTYDQWKQCQSKMDNYLDRVLAQGKCIIIGEYGIYNNGDVRPAEDYTLKAVQSRRIGRIEWAFWGGDQNELTVSGNGGAQNSTYDANGNCTNLSTFGLKVWNDNRRTETLGTRPTSCGTTVGVTGVSVSPSTASITTGQSQQLVATISPSNATNQSVSWSSGNTAVATVNSSGIVTGVSAGTATITVTTQDGNKTATSTITVTASSGSPIVVNNTTVGTGNNQFSYSGSWALSSGTTGKYQSDDHYSSTTGSYYTVTFTGTQVKLYATKNAHHGIAGVSIDGGTETNVDFYSSSVQFQSLVYTSPTLSNASHTVRVRVTGSKNASATGYVITADRADIITTATTVAVSGVSVSPTSATLAVNGTQQLTATVSPSNATNKNVSWNSSNAAVATVNSAGLVTGVTAGTATITVTTQDGNKTASSTITVSNPVTASTYQAESFTAQSTGNINTTQFSGYTGSGYIDYGNFSGAWIEWNNVTSSQAGSRTLTFRYANGSTVNRTCNITVNGNSAGTVSFAPSSAWTTWKTMSITVTLNGGNNTIRVTSTTSAGGPNLDKMDVAATTSSASQGQAIMMEVESSGIDVYPNPSNGEIHIRLKSADSKAAVSIFTSTGNRVYSKDFTEVDIITLNPQLLPGVYFMKVNNESVKLIIK